MTAEALPVARSWGRARLILLGGLTVGVLDATDAIVFFGLRGVKPMRIFQAIASGVLGRSSFSGGTATVLLGGSFHFVIATTIVATYYFASRRFATLIRYPIVCGLVYGALVYAFMNLLVVPLSALTRGPMTFPVFLNGIGIHLVEVGLPSALFARRGLA